MTLFVVIPAVPRAPAARVHGRAVGGVGSFTTMRADVMSSEDMRWLVTTFLGTVIMAYQEWLRRKANTQTTLLNGRMDELKTSAYAEGHAAGKIVGIASVVQAVAASPAVVLDAPAIAAVAGAIIGLAPVPAKPQEGKP